MADAKKCNRCGAFYTTQRDIKVHFVTDPCGKVNYLQLEYIDKSERKRLDLCPVCADDLVQFFEVIQ